jgi:hypothetical protein
VPKQTVHMTTCSASHMTTRLNIQCQPPVVLLTCLFGMLCRKASQSIRGYDAACGTNVSQS